MCVDPDRAHPETQRRVDAGRDAVAARPRIRWHCLSLSEQFRERRFALRSTMRMMSKQAPNPLSMILLFCTTGSPW
jgi:HJR/Mrr/RecB family endonuclease